MPDVVLAKLESIGSETDVRGFHPPFSILYLADALEKAGFRPKIIHEEGTEAITQSLVDLITAEKPAFVGFSVVTGPQILPSLKASMEIKKRCDLPVIWGGIQPTLLPRQALSKACIDLLVMGEGERTIVELARIAVQHGLREDTFDDVAGIAFRRDGHVVFTAPRPFIRDLDDSAAAWHYLDIQRYIRPEIYLDSRLGGGMRAIAVNTSRGCPWRCGYCYNVAFNKRSVRSQSAARVIEEIRDLKERYDISSVRFSDDYFFSSRARAVEIIRNIEIPWTATIRASDLADGGDDFVKTIAESQCALLRSGAESGSQRILDFMQKDISLEQIREAAALCKKYNVRVGFFFMAGFPGESWSEILETLDLMDELEAIGENVMTSSPAVFCPFPGTPLLQTAIQSGFSSPSTLEEWGTTIDAIVRNSGSLPPYVDRRVERIIDYLRLARVRDFDSTALSLPVKILRRIAKARWKRRFFSIPIDWYIANLGRKSLRRLGRM